MKKELTIEELQLQNAELINRLEEAEQLIEAIKAGEVDAFALNRNNQPEIFTLQSGDYGYRMLVENINEGAVTLAEDGLIVYTNNYFHELLGISYEDVIGNTVFNFIHPDSKETFNELFKKGLEEKSKGEINLVAGDKIICAYVSLTSLFPTLQTVGMIVTDLTEKKNQEEALRLSEEKFNKLFSSAPLGLGLSEISTGRLVDVNQTLLDMIGYTRDEYIGKTSLELDIMTKSGRDKVVEQVSKNGFVRNLEINLRTKSGKIIPVLNSIETITINDKKYFLGAMVDITQRKDTEKEIEQKNTDLEKMNIELQSFAYISSHDMQEPLRKIQIFATRIIEKEVDNLSENAKEQFQKMQNAAKRMQTLIEDLLAYSRAKTSERHFEKTDLNKIIEVVKDDLKEELKEKQATIEVAKLCNAEVIPFQFRQMMHNLIGNSLKFSLPDQPPHIKIESQIVKGIKLNNEKLSPEVKYCHISITDNGIGFEPEFKEKIFEVFQRLHRKDQYKGTGIGLAIVKKIVENHNGEITAESEVGKGARFNIFLPAT
ncbi:MAG: PAS domain S-box protein [Bacteroidetes bacterium]|nr:MAG: PAS domain S-box protein [Bacteroidota bacterium]